MGQHTGKAGFIKSLDRPRDGFSGDSNLFVVSEEFDFSVWSSCDRVCFAVKVFLEFREGGHIEGLFLQAGAHIGHPVASSAITIVSGATRVSAAAGVTIATRVPVGLTAGIATTTKMLVLSVNKGSHTTVWRFLLRMNWIHQSIRSSNRLNTTFCCFYTSKRKESENMKERSCFVRVFGWRLRRWKAKGAASEMGFFIRTEEFFFSSMQYDWTEWGNHSLFVRPWRIIWKGLAPLANYSHLIPPSTALISFGDSAFNW